MSGCWLNAALRPKSWPPNASAVNAVRDYSLHDSSVGVLMAAYEETTGKRFPPAERERSIAALAWSDAPRNSRTGPCDSAAVRSSLVVCEVP